MAEFCESQNWQDSAEFENGSNLRIPKMAEFREGQKSQKNVDLSSKI
jgi:hypothetical protein